MADFRIDPKYPGALIESISAGGAGLLRIPGQAILPAASPNVADGWFDQKQGDTAVFRELNVPQGLSLVAIEWCGQSPLTGGATTALAMDVSILLSTGDTVNLLSNGTTSGVLTGLAIAVGLADNPITFQARNDGPGDASAHQYDFGFWFS